MSIKKEIFSGVKYTAIAQYSNVFANLLIGSILSRLLTPSDYGTVALVTVFVTFFALLSDIGFGAGIVQYKELSTKQISSLFNFSILVGLFIAVLFWIASHWIADFYHNKIYIRIGHVFSIPILLSACSTIPAGIMRREKKFKQIGMLTVSTSVFTGIVGIILAFKGFSYWALIIRSILSSFILFVGNLLISRVFVNYSLTLNLRGLSSFGKFSFFNFLFNFVNYFSRNLDNLLIGKYLGAAQLGFYDKSYTLMKLPLDNLMTVITPVMHPILGGNSRDESQIINVHLKLSKLMAMLGVPISVYIYYCRNEIISIVYGGQWLISADSLKWLSLSIWIQMVLSSNGSFFLIQGKSNYYFLGGLLSAVTVIIAVIAGISYGSAELIAFFIMLAFLINLFQGYYLLYKYVLFIPYFTLFNTLKKPVLIGIICFLVLVPFNYYTFGIASGLLLKTFALMFGYLVGLLITKEYKWMLENFGVLLRLKK